MQKVLNYSFPKLIILFFLATVMWQCGDTPSEEATAEQAQSETVTNPVAGQPQATPISRPDAGEVVLDEIRWISWDEAVAANEKQPKMLFIDVYTDWCGWCKVMDKQTFTDPEVVEYINKNYYAVKFNAEKEDPVNFRGQEFKVVEGGRRGIHTLAYALLEGQLSYPSYVYLNKDFQRVNVSKGFKPAEPFLQEMRAVTEAYLQ